MNALHSYICIFIVFFIISEVMLQPVLLHTCMHVIIGNRVVQKSREALLLLLLLLLLSLSLLFFNFDCVDLSCVLFLAVDGLDVAVASAN